MEWQWRWLELCYVNHYPIYSHIMCFCLCESLSYVFTYHVFLFYKVQWSWTKTIKTWTRWPNSGMMMKHFYRFICLLMPWDKTVQILWYISKSSKNVKNLEDCSNFILIQNHRSTDRFVKCYEKTRWLINTCITTLYIYCVLVNLYMWHMHLISAMKRDVHFEESLSF